MGKRYHEVEFGVWVEEPDPLRQAPCDAVWNGDWDHAHGPRPRCFRPEGHDGDHHDTRSRSGEDEWIEYFWTEDPAEARTELRHPDDPPEGAG